MVGNCVWNRQRRRRKQWFYGSLKAGTGHENRRGAADGGFTCQRECPTRISVTEIKFGKVDHESDVEELIA